MARAPVLRNSRPPRPRARDHRRKNAVLRENRRLRSPGSARSPPTTTRSRRVRRSGWNRRHMHSGFGVHGDNVVERSQRMPWYEDERRRGSGNGRRSTIIGCSAAPFVFRCNGSTGPTEFRGFSGQACLRRRSDPAIKYRSPLGPREPSGADRDLDGDLDLPLQDSRDHRARDEVDVSRGDVIADADTLPGWRISSRSTLVWMAEEPMLRGRQLPPASRYELRRSATVRPTRAQGARGLARRIAAEALELNEIGVCEIEPRPADPIRSVLENRDTGGSS